MNGILTQTSDFRELRESGGYFVDKTGFIVDIVENLGALVPMFTRPGGFGKTMNLTMLDAFYNVAYKGNHWFHGLEVMQHEECLKVMNSYPVIFLSLSGLDVGTMEGFLDSFAERISEICKLHGYISESDIGENRCADFLRLKMKEGDKSDLRRSLLHLSNILERYHGKDVIVLIDDYDDPVNRSYGTGTGEEILGFMRLFLGNGLKDNSSLKLGVLTGLTPIAKNSMDPEVNNFNVNDISTRNFSTRFGFTESEVRKILEHHGHSERMDEIREWYGGYSIGGADLFSPWGVLSYVGSGLVTGTHWIDKEDPAMLTEYVCRSGYYALKIISGLYSDGEASIPRFDNMMMPLDRDNIGGLLSLMVNSGYLSVNDDDNGDRHLALMNSTVGEHMLRRIIGRYAISEDIAAALLEGDPGTVRDLLGDILNSPECGLLLTERTGYPLFVLGLLDHLHRTHGLRSVLGKERGYPDVIITPRDGEGCSAAFEIKHAEDGSLRKAADDALRNIHDCRHIADLFGEIGLYGIAVGRTGVHVSFKKVHKEGQDTEDMHG